jgi:hypothetical protein
VLKNVLAFSKGRKGFVIYTYKNERLGCSGFMLGKFVVTSLADTAEGELHDNVHSSVNNCFATPLPV